MNTHPYLPHNYKDLCVVYTGTHDNNTILGWFKNEASEQEINNLQKYAHKEISSRSICWDLIHMAFHSSAKIAIIPMQDLLELGDDARMNKPGTTGSKNWRWRLLPSALTQEVAKKLSDITVATERA